MHLSRSLWSQPRWSMFPINSTTEDYRYLPHSHPHIRIHYSGIPNSLPDLPIYNYKIQEPNHRQIQIQCRTNIWSLYWSMQSSWSQPRLSMFPTNDNGTDIQSNQTRSLPSHIHICYFGIPSRFPQMLDIYKNKEPCHRSTINQRCRMVFR